MGKGRDPTRKLRKYSQEGKLRRMVGQGTHESECFKKGVTDAAGRFNKMNAKR